jgi:hypothetical protein
VSEFQLSAVMLLATLLVTLLATLLAMILELPTAVELAIRTAREWAKVSLLLHPATATAEQVSDWVHLLQRTSRVLAMVLGK